MKHATETLAVETRAPGLVQITDAVVRWVRRQEIASGVLTVWCQHTSASLLVQENASPEVLADLQAFFSALAPHMPGRYRHAAEGPDDMPAHIRAALTQPGLSIPVANGAPMLGQWQGIFLFEHRTGMKRRKVVLHLMG